MENNYLNSKPKKLLSFHQLKVSKPLGFEGHLNRLSGRMDFTTLGPRLPTRHNNWVIR